MSIEDTVKNAWMASLPIKGAGRFGGASRASVYRFGWMEARA